MNQRLLGIGALSLACVTAAGVGGYLAQRHNAASLPRAEAAADAPSASVVPAAQATEVQPPPPVAPADVAPPEPAVAPVARVPEPAVPATRPTRARVPAPRPAAAEARPQPAVPAAPVPPPVASMDPPVAAVPQLPAPLEPAAPEAAAPEFDEIVVPAEAVIGLQVENSVSSETARIEDQVSARVTRDVRVAGRVAIPAGSRVQGSVVMVVRGGKFKERARLGIRFHRLITADGVIPLQTETVFREGDSPVGESTAKVSAGAIGGAIIGAIVGGGRGAAIGSAAGAGAGTAAVAASDRSEARIAAGANVTVRLAQPVFIQVER